MTTLWSELNEIIAHEVRIVQNCPLQVREMLVWCRTNFGVERLRSPYYNAIYNENDNCVGKWAVRFESENAELKWIVFWFFDIKDAIFFKLKWG